MTSPTDKQPATKELIDELSRIRKSDEPTSIDQFNKQLFEVVVSIGNLTRGDNGAFQEADALRKFLNSRSTPLSHRYISIIEKYNYSFSEFTNCRSVVIQSSKSETRAHLKNLLFRILTTLGVGFSIMLVYAAAHYFEIPMPLMKLPIPT